MPRPPINAVLRQAYSRMGIELEDLECEEKEEKEEIAENREHPAKVRERVSISQ